MSEFLYGVCNAVSRIYVPLMASESPICSSLSLFPYHVAHGSALWMEQGEVGCLATSCPAGCSLTLSQFPLWKKSWVYKVLLGAGLCLLAVGMTSVKSNFSSNLVLSIQTDTFFFFSPAVC